MTIKDITSQLILSNHFDLQYERNGIQYEICSSDFVEQYLIDNYYLYTLYNCDTFSQFVTKWQLYKQTFFENLVNIHVGMIEEYDKINNYDKMSDILHGIKRDDMTTTQTDNTTTTNDLTTTDTGTTTNNNTKNLKDLTKNKEISFDNHTLLQNAESETDTTGTDNTTTTNNLTNKNTGTVKNTGTTTNKTEYANTLNQTSLIDNKAVVGNEIEHTYEHTKGNIGVVSAHDLLEKEIVLRMNNYLIKWLRAFFDNNLYYVGGDI